jgi:hypothetical protein
MKTLYTTLASLFVAFSCLAQINLVKNPDFERYRTCPRFYDQIAYAYYWNGIDTSWSPDDTLVTWNPPCIPDLISNCTSKFTLTWPFNAFFYQFPHSGINMSQITVYHKYDTSVLEIKRDYLQGRLSKTLVAGHTYCVRFYTALHNRMSSYAINKIGAYIDDGSIDTSRTCGEPQWHYTPQVYAASILADTVNWMKVEGSFTARGGEKFITIGNFSKAVDTDTLRYYFREAMTSSNTVNSFYLIDDVSLIDADAVPYAGRDTTLRRGGDSVWVGNRDGYVPCYWYRNGTMIDSNKSGFMSYERQNASYVMELDLCGTIKRDTMMVLVVGAQIGAVQEQLQLLAVYPTPTTGVLHIERAAGLAYTLTDAAGRALLVGTLKQDTEQLTIDQLPPGVYLLTLRDADSGQSVTKRVVKQ